MSFESVHELVDRASDFGGEQTPVVPSAKAMGKRKVVADANGDSDGMALQTFRALIVLNVHFQQTHPIQRSSLTGAYPPF